jgi:hypothetical protein
MTVVHRPRLNKRRHVGGNPIAKIIPHPQKPDLSDARGPSSDTWRVWAAAKLLSCKRETVVGRLPSLGCTWGELMLRAPSTRWLDSLSWGRLRPVHTYIGVRWPWGYALCPYASATATMRWPRGETSSTERLRCRSSRCERRWANTLGHGAPRSGGLKCGELRRVRFYALAGLCRSSAPRL